MPNISPDKSVQNRILAMIAAYGSNTEYWSDRAAACALSEADSLPADIRKAMDDARRLDACLAQDKIARPSPALVSRILDMARPVPPVRSLKLAYAFLAAFLAGAGVAYAQTRSADEAELAALSMLVYGASIADSQWLTKPDAEGNP